MKNVFRKKTGLLLTVGLLLVAGAVWVLMWLVHYSVPVWLKTRFERYLIVDLTLPQEKADALYILGGSALSTECHIKKAASLFQECKCERILIFDSDDLWHYDATLRRNITRNELTIRMLTEQGVPLFCIDTIPFRKGFFGTLSEACALHSYLRMKHFRTVILLSSPCHTRRVSNCFRCILKPLRISTFISASDDHFSFSEMMLETLKIQVYQIVTPLLSFSLR